MRRRVTHGRQLANWAWRSATVELAPSTPTAKLLEQLGGREVVPWTGAWLHRSMCSGATEMSSMYVCHAP